MTSVNSVRFQLYLIESCNKGWANKVCCIQVREDFNYPLFMQEFQKNCPYLVNTFVIVVPKARASWYTYVFSRIFLQLHMKRMILLRRRSDRLTKDLPDSFFISEEYLMAEFMRGQRMQ